MKSSDGQVCDVMSVRILSIIDVVGLTCSFNPVLHRLAWSNQNAVVA